MAISSPVILDERFWSKVNKSAPPSPHAPELGNCWEWTAARSHRGHGIYSFDSKTCLAYHASWVGHGNELPQESGKLLAHRCANSSCVRPDHLKIATRLVNNCHRVSANKTSQTGIRGVGVRHNKGGTRYIAYGHIERKRRVLGTFDTPEEAGEVAEKWRLDNHPSISD